MSDILAAERAVTRKKHLRHDALSDHVSSLNVYRPAKQLIEDGLTELENVIASVPDLGKRIALNDCTLIIRIRELASGQIEQFNRQINGEVNNMTTINTAVQSDGDYSVTEKEEFATALANEV